MEILPLRRAVATVLIAALVPAVELPGPVATVAEPPGAAAWIAAGLPDPVATSPAAAARFLATADPALAVRYPGVVGNLDGAPPRVRYEANRRTMLALGGPPAGWAAAGRHFYAFDPRGDGLATEVLGDLDTAVRVVVLVPGVDSTLAAFERGHGGVARRAPVVQARWLAEEIRAERRRRGQQAGFDQHRSGGAGGDPDGARIAVVAWLGYDPPEGLGLAAIRRDRARDGAAALARFVAGLAVVRPGLPVTLVGHSYGSTVIGLAARSFGPSVTDVVAIGSPGMGVRHAADLPGIRVWAARGRTDWIRRVPSFRFAGFGLGGDPVAGGFGARVFSAGQAEGHDGYYLPGTASLRALARITLGLDPGNRAGPADA